MKKIIKILLLIALMAPFLLGLTMFFIVALIASITQFIFPGTKMLAKVIEFVEYVEKYIGDFVNKNQMK